MPIIPVLLTILNSIDWDSEFRGINQDTALDRLYSHFNDVIVSFVPIRVYKQSHFPRWFSARLKSLIRNKKKARKDFKASNSHSDYLLFCDLRSQCKALTKSDYRAYVDDVENSVRYNPRSFWSFVKAKRGICGLPSSMHRDRTTASSDSAIVDLFATFLARSTHLLLGRHRP